MRRYKITGEGKKVVRVPTSDRQPLLDFLYGNSTADLDTLKAVGGPSTLHDIRILVNKGYIEEANINVPI